MHFARKRFTQTIWNLSIVEKLGEGETCSEQMLMEHLR